ncbi:hypothetical protein E2C01_083093 [Portunus trituberculatus]|uniref:Uncharacterized protein n=1 Tax=Portunus trituberculatus TaxID=210409 RepID=A0A5B7J2I9_PORTR|nr:hypothetical protein [Portunus trituberculatus]
MWVSVGECGGARLEGKGWLAGSGTDGWARTDGWAGWVWNLEWIGGLQRVDGLATVESCGTVVGLEVDWSGAGEALRRGFEFDRAHLGEHERAKGCGFPV